MFALAILIGIYSYLILDLGFLGLLYKQNVIIVSFLYLLLLLFFYKSFIKKIFTQFLNSFKKRQEFLLNNKYKLSFFLISLFVVQGLINLVGALGPELSFDALWYHLTFPKLYLSNNAIIHTVGGHFYYSYMPKLTEMLYVSALSFGDEVLVKTIHFSFGILSSVALYKLSRKFLSEKMSLLVVVVFYSNLVVSWESITAYIDLARTFFEVLALFAFLIWMEKRPSFAKASEGNEKRWFIISAIMLGLAIATKVLALQSLIIFIFLIVIYFIRNKKPTKKIFTHSLVYSCIALFVPLPWFVFSYINTGNPIYPFFTNVYKVNIGSSLIDPLRFITDIWNLLVKAEDPISPLYIIFFPLILIFFKRFKFELKIISVYSLLSLILWYITPRTGGGRFILPYLPAFSLIVVCALKEVWTIKLMRILCLILTIFVSLTSIVYRGIANGKYLPVVLGKQSKSEFLSKNLNFSYGDFYDTDEYFKNQITSKDKVLLYGFHNIYYAEFPFIESSFVKSGDKFNHVATQNSDLPERFRYWNLIYENNKTHVKLYSLGGQEWVY